MEVSDARVMVGVPTRGRINHNTVQRLLDLQRTHPDVTYVVQAAGISIADTRHQLIQRFLRSPCEVLIQVDDDVVPPMHMFRLLESPHDITGGVYLVVTSFVNIPFLGAFVWDGEEYRPILDGFRQRGRRLVDGVVSGCLAAKRCVYEILKAPFALPYSDTGVCIGSDDLAFCTRARAAGLTIAADFSVWCDHLPDGASLNRMHDQYTKARMVPT